MMWGASAAGALWPITYRDLRYARVPVVLAPLGLENVERARGIIDAVEELARAARAGCEPLTGTVRMGVIPTIGPFLLPRVLPHLRQTYNCLKLYLIEDLTTRLLDALHQGKLDAGAEIASPPLLGW